jgi:hypothetical protein
LTSWLKAHDYLRKIQEIWEQPTRDVNALDRVLFKLKNVKSFLKGWGFNRTGDHKKKKMEINVKIMILDNLEEVSLLLEEQV